MTERPEQPTDEQETAPAAEQSDEMAEAIEFGRFDQGRMWTFEDPPIEHFAEEYDFRPEEDWFTQARLGTLRFSDFCTASFVSPHGLVMTNHHCGREAITQVSREEEDLLERGFYAMTLSEERAVPKLHVDQVVDIEDVTEQVYAALEGIPTRQSEVEARVRSQRANTLGDELTAEAQAQDSMLHVEVVELYNGARYSAYTYRRYDDVRLVMAPELQLGFFGGNPDNFTFPRYALDVSFFRVYDEEGEPLQPSNYFHWSAEGSRKGDPVFAVGNPGATERLNTVAQLRFQRDYSKPQQLEALEARSRILSDFIEEHPERADDYELRNLYFSLENSIKSTRGELQGLRDPELMARREASEEALRQQISTVDTLRENYGNVFEEVRRIQRSKESIARQTGAFTFYGNPRLGSRILGRATYGYFLDQARRQGASPQQIEQIREEALAFEDWPEEVERAMIAQRLREMQSYLGESDPSVRRVLQGRSPEELAAHLVENSALVDSARFADILEEGYLQSEDASIAVIEPLASLFLELARQQNNYQAAERNLSARIARVRFAVASSAVPPDASFSLRISDGIVQGYPYNGTYAPAYTTFYGLYNRFYTHVHAPWELPERWVEPPAHFERSTPLNLVSTNDITGGSSGSPLINQDLEIVGLIFDSNIEALPNTFLFREEAARAISVDSRGILEALDVIYEADRLVDELTAGVLVPEEQAGE